MAQPDKDDRWGWGHHTAAGFIAALGLIGFALFFRRYPIPEFLPKISALAACVWFVYILFTIGQLWERVLDLSNLKAGVFTHLLARVLLGLGSLSVLILLSGWLLPGHLITKFQILFGLLFALSLFNFIQNKHWQKVREIPISTTQLPIYLFALPAAGLLTSFVCAFGPITYYDSLVYHLALPSAYLQIGAIKIIPFNLYCYFPATMEMNFMLIMSSLPAPEYVINLFGWTIALLLGGTVMEWTASFTSKKGGWISGLLFWTTPFILLLSQGAYVDVALAAAATATLFFYTEGRADRKVSVYFLSGILGGLCFSIKYTGVLVIIILGAHLVLTTVRNKQSQALIAFFAGAMIFPTPWLLKNLMTVGNPLYPFFYNHWGPANGWAYDAANGYFQMLKEYSITNNAIFDLIRNNAPSRGGFDVLGDFGWAIVFIFSPFAILFNKGKKGVQFLAGYALIHALTWYLSKPVFRFLICLYPILIILASVSIHSLWHQHKAWYREMMVFLVAPWIISNIFIYGLFVHDLKLLSVPLGIQSSTEFLRSRLAAYPIFEGINSQPHAPVLLIGDQRTYHLKMPFYSSHVFAPSPVAGFFNLNPSAQDAILFLQQHNIEKIIMNEGEINRLGGLKRFGFQPEGEGHFRQFLKKFSTIIMSNSAVNLHQIHRNQVK